MSYIENNGVKRPVSHALSRRTPSKWDDAQKWLVGLSKGGHKTQSKASPRNSNADDLSLIHQTPQKSDVGCDESTWRNKPASENSTASTLRSVRVRDMGTETTPIASQEASRNPTPVRATANPVCLGSSTTERCRHGREGTEESLSISKGNKNHQNLEQGRKMNSLESRAMAWDEAERAKYMARYKREEVKIQAWENNEKRKAEMEMRKTEAKAERIKARAEEKMANKLSATKRIAAERSADEEAKLNEKAIRISERADYIRRTGHLPSSFSFKLPSLCW